MTTVTTKATHVSGTTAGVRKVRDRFTHYLARVRAGETVVITDRGKPVAILKPATAGTTWEERKAQMAAEGLLILATRRKSRTWKPIQIPPGKPLSEIIIEDREDRI